MRSDSRARCSDFGERVKSYAGKTRGDFSFSSLSSFFCFLVNFSSALYDLNASNRLTDK